MGDYTDLQLFVHDCPDDQAAALVAVIVDRGLHVDWDGPFAEPGELHIGTPYTSRGAAGDDSSDVADALSEAAPGAKFTVWTDPAYEWLGALVRYTPELGLHHAECDAEGNAVFSASELLHQIDKSESLDDLRAYVGAPWTDALTGTADERTITYEVPDEDEYDHSRAKEDARNACLDEEE